MEIGNLKKAYAKSEVRALINLDFPDFEDNLNLG
jgi:hypothetical protein